MKHDAQTVLQLVPKKKGNPYKNRKGKYTDQCTARIEQTEKERDTWKERALYFESVYKGSAQMIRMKDEEILKLKQS
ncbi:MAG: hypothetical protein JXQ69_03690 [Paludibacteraceae bacterium]|nr:hypothetical protein [Paludibacteraceae bacterium]